MKVFILTALLLILIPSVRLLLYACVGYASYALEERRKLTILRKAMTRRRDTF